MKINALSIDVEEWFQVSAFDSILSPASWAGFSPRVEANVLVLLDLLAAAKLQATFFILGWVAERHPQLVQRLAAAGHEIASHGTMHQRVWRLDPKAFAQDLSRSKRALEDAAGVAVTGYRAPSFSIDPRTPWAYPILAEQGFTYSSSVAPFGHDHYGWPGSPPSAWRPLPGSDFLELPVASISLFGRRIGAGGGGFFRLYPYALSRWMLRRVNQMGASAVFYIHPWEIDLDQPRLPEAPLAAQWRHQVGRASMLGKLHRLMRDFSWAPVGALAAMERELCQ